MFHDAIIQPTIVILTIEGGELWGTSTLYNIILKFFNEDTFLYN